MGWDFTKDASKADIVKECLSGGAKPTEYFPIAQKIVGNCLWVVFEHNSQDRNARFIALYLLEKQRGFGWGYKPMEESMGPYEVSCPLQFLEITPLPVSPYAASWREKVREYHGKKAADRLRQGEGIKRNPCVECGRHVEAINGSRCSRCSNGVLLNNCADCLVEHVDVVVLSLDGKCSCCATGHKLAGKQVA